MKINNNILRKKLEHGIRAKLKRASFTEKEKRLCCRTRKLGLFIKEEFQPKDHLEK
jgi:hypothetical protein